MYSESRPGTSLRPWVAAVWHSKVDGGSMAVLPDGCADLLLDLERESVSVVGTMTKPVVVSPEDRRNLLGVRFRPGRLATILGIPLRELTDAVVPLRNVSRRLELHAGSIEADLMRLVTDGDRRVDAAVQAIIRSGGTCDVERLADTIGVTRQHLARLFAHHIGVPPKMFARIIRFRYALQLGRQQPWADVAARLRYVDQSHLIADFREFSGTTPVPFFLSAGQSGA
ncbi:MAG TPA: DUF6597 domain-containing transcriptional factor [Thermoanaerobaculia bacterium]